MYALFSGLDESAQVLLSLSIILLSGFLVTRLTKLLHLPNVSGYIVAGVLIGPQALALVPESIVGHAGFVSDLALAFIAFGVGKFFKRSVLVRTGGRVLFITLCEALVAGVLVTACMRGLFHLPWDFSLLLGAIATATAPASTMMTIRQYHARGEYVNTLLQVVALDDVLCLLCFSVAVAVVNAMHEGHVSVMSVVLPAALNLVVIAAGFLCGVLLSRLLTPTRSKDNRLILAVALLCGICALCAALGVSPLLACMVFGATYVNLTQDKKLFRQLDRFTPPVLSMFFILSGINLDLSALATAGMIGAMYFLVRIVGKYGGMFAGGLITRMPAKHRNAMGLALIPQAGVAIGLAFLGQRLLPGEIGDLLLTVILSSSVLYEIVGPGCAKLSFFLSGTISRDAAGAKPAKINAKDRPKLRDCENPV